MTKVGRILLCVSGGYQSYATPGFVLALLKHVADDVVVVLSRAAAKMVSRKAVEVASRHTVYVELTMSARTSGCFAANDHRIEHHSAAGQPCEPHVCRECHS